MSKSHLANVKYIERRISHHAQHSGYDILFPFMGLQPASSRFSKILTAILPASLKWRMHRLRPQQVADEGLIPELKGLTYTMFGKERLCHFIYGEDTFFYTPLWVNKYCKLICTYHYPETRLYERVNPALMNALDAVVIVSNVQRPYFQRFLDNDKIHFIPHHVDTDFFKPFNDQERPNEYRIISIGHILRDHDLLRELIENINNVYSDVTVHFDLVIPENKHSYFTNIPNVHIHSSISDEELLSLYNHATIGFMPLLDCTANNGILEMMSCGIPVVCKDVGGVGDYLDERGAVLFSQDWRGPALANVVVDLLINANQRRKMGAYNRNKAVKEFSLGSTEIKMFRLYEQILNSPSKNEIF